MIVIVSYKLFFFTNKGRLLIPSVLAEFVCPNIGNNLSVTHRYRVSGVSWLFVHRSLQILSHWSEYTCSNLAIYCKLGPFADRESGHYLDRLAAPHMVGSQLGPR